MCAYLFNLKATIKSTRYGGVHLGRMRENYPQGKSAWSTVGRAMRRVRGEKKTATLGILRGKNTNLLRHSEQKFLETRLEGYEVRY